MEGRSTKSQIDQILKVLMSQICYKACSELCSKHKACHLLVMLRHVYSLFDVYFLFYCISHKIQLF